jgi:hypothetical protein
VLLSRVVGAAVLAVLVNVPVVLSVPRQGSPRLFTPTWLVLAAMAAMVGAAVRWRRTALLGAAAGLFAAGALVSLAWSVQVGMVSADAVEQAARQPGSRVADGDVVALCGVRRTVVEPAPRGAFAVHEFVYDWAAADALTYYSGRQVELRLAGELWAQPCPDPATSTSSYRSASSCRNDDKTCLPGRHGRHPHDGRRGPARMPLLDLGRDDLAAGAHLVDQGRRADVAAWIAELRDDGLNARHLPSSQRGMAAATTRASSRCGHRSSPSPTTIVASAVTG